MLNTSDYDNRLKTLRENRILLDTEPLSRGLPYLMSKIAEVQKVRDLVLDVLIEAMQDRTAKSNHLESLETEHKMEIQGMLANDPDVKGQKSADLRSSLANVKVADLALKVHHATIDLAVANGYLSIVQHFYENLQKLTHSLDQQISLVQLHYEHNKPQ